MKTINTFLCWILAGAMALGIIVSLVVCSSIIAMLCGFSFFSVLGIVAIAFFVAMWVLLNSLFKDLDISFSGDDGDDDLM